MFERTLLKNMLLYLNICSQQVFCELDESSSSPGPKPSFINYTGATSLPPPAVPSPLHPGPKLLKDGSSVRELVSSAAKHPAFQLISAGKGMFSVSQHLEEEQR